MSNPDLRDRATGLVTFERLLSAAECVAIAEAWVGAVGLPAGELGFQVNRNRVGRSKWRATVLDATVCNHVGVDAKGLPPGLAVRNSYARSGSTVPFARLDWSEIAERAAIGEVFVAVAEACGALRYGSLAYGVPPDGAPHAELFGYGWGSAPALADYIPGYHWVTVLGERLAAVFSRHRDFAAYPGLAPRWLTNGAVVFRATEDPLTVTPELLVALRAFFAPMFPPQGPRKIWGHRIPCLYAPEDERVVYQKLDEFAAERKAADEAAERV